MDAEFRTMLERLRRAGPPAPTPLPDDLERTVRQVWMQAPDAASAVELCERFVRSASAAGARVQRCDAASWPRAVCELLRDRAPGLVAVYEASFPPSLAPSLEVLRGELSALGLRVSVEPDDDELFGAAGTVTGAAALIAETGSVVCESSPALPRSASLIVPLHIVVARDDQILPDLCDYFAALARRAAGLPSSVSLITGPSKTADIEGVLVTGVHGPGEVCIVLVPAGADNGVEERGRCADQ